MANAAYSISIRTDRRPLAAHRTFVSDMGKADCLAFARAMLTHKKPTQDELLGALCALERAMRL
jgi:hypothetical protein